MAEFKTKEDYEKWKAERAKGIYNKSTATPDLSDDNSFQENIIWQGKPEWSGQAFPLFLCGLLFLAGVGVVLIGGSFAFIIVSLVLAFITFLYRIQYDFKVTDKRIIARKGLLGRVTGELDIKDIRSINVIQGITQRIFGIGHIEFTTASGPIKEVMLINIKDPDGLKEKIRRHKTA